MKTKSESLSELVASVRQRRKAAGAAPAIKSGWQAAFGSVKDDELFREAARLGEAYRKRENQRG
jgi:hypothetical protein